MDQNPIEKCIKTAKGAGCPRDQVKNLMEKGYIPLPWQWAFHAAARMADEDDGPVDIGLGGARGPGKSHAVLSQAALDDCLRVDNLKGLFLRQTGTAAKESFDDLVQKVVSGHTEFEKVSQVLKFPNGSRILLGGFKDEGDIDKYVGVEYDFIIVEELNQLTSEKYEKLRGSLRTSKPNWRPRMYTSFNPGGIGHEFVKARYIEPARNNKEVQTRFVGSTYKSNPYLNKEYVSYLEELQGDLGKAWREGEWDLFAGQYFSNWKRDQHVVKAFKIPESWRKFRSIDPSGRIGFTSCNWYALDSDGNAWVYREYYRTGMDHDEHAKEINRLSQEKDGTLEDYVYTVIDTAAFAKAGYSETIADIYNRHGVHGLIPAAKERVVGWNAVNFYLRWKEGIKPKLRIFENCKDMIRTIPQAQHDELHPEDVASIGSKFKDEKGNEGTEHQDILDNLRYFLRTLREQKSDKELTVVEKRLKQLKEQEAQFGFQYSRASSQFEDNEL